MNPRITGLLPGLMGIFIFLVLLARAPASLAELALYEQAQPLPPMPLIDHHGEKTTLTAAGHGPWHLVFLGYTQCPDICPVHMAHLRQMMQILDEQQADLPAVTFVSVDPDRDTPEVLAAYVRQFDPRFTGATSAGSYLKTLQHTLDAHVVIRNKHDHDHYQMLHQTRIYLLDGKGRWVGHFMPPFNGRELAAAVMSLPSEPITTAEKEQ